MAEDWRVKITLADDAGGRSLTDRLAAPQLEREAHELLGQRIAVSRDGADVFLYAETETAARAAEHVAQRLLAEHGVDVPVVLDRWHPEAEEWQPATRPLPATPEERAAEHERMISREDADTAARGYPRWEVRVELGSRHEAHELSERLDAGGVPHVRRWRYVLVGAVDEDAARALEQRLRDVAPAGSRVSVEGTFTELEHENPFAVFSGIA